jgi:hypothetical protein
VHLSEFPLPCPLPLPFPFLPEPFEECAQKPSLHAHVGHPVGVAAHDEPINPVQDGHGLHVPSAGLFLLFDDVSQNSLPAHADAVQFRFPQLSTPPQLHEMGVQFLPSTFAETNETRTKIQMEKIIFYSSSVWWVCF